MSDEKELNRRKEVDDLISKYARKKAPPHPVGIPPPSTALGQHQNSAHSGPNIPLQKDYSSSSLKFRDHYGGGGGPANHHSRPGDNIYGTMPNSHSHQRDSLYGAGSSNLYGGASSSNLYGGASTSNLFPRRSSQYDMPPPPLPGTQGGTAQYGVEPPIYEHHHQGPQRPQKYLATSKSSSNLYLQPHYGTGYGGSNMDPNNRSLTRQQKTLSMHGAPSTGGGRNNNVMDTAAAIIANAHQQSNNNMGGLGNTTDWWSNTSYGMPSGGVPQPPPPGIPGPVELSSGLPPIQNDWNNLKPSASSTNMWNPLPSFGGGNNSAATSSTTTTTSNKPVFSLTFCLLV